MISTVATKMNFKLHSNKVKGLNSDTQTRSLSERRKVTGKKGPATELEPGTCTLSQSFSHRSHWSESQILRLPLPYVPGIGVPL